MDFRAVPSISPINDICPIMLCSFWSPCNSPFLPWSSSSKSLESLMGFNLMLSHNLQQDFSAQFRMKHQRNVWSDGNQWHLPYLLCTNSTLSVSPCFLSRTPLSLSWQNVWPNFYGLPGSYFINQESTSLRTYVHDICTLRTKPIFSRTIFLDS